MNRQALLDAIATLEASKRDQRCYTLRIDEAEALLEVIDIVRGIAATVQGRRGSQHG